MYNFNQNFQIADGPYRYVLGRVIPENRDNPKTICFIMLNPSTADDKEDDRTMEKVIKFARREGGSHVTVVNLLAYREKDPEKLISLMQSDLPIDPIGPFNNKHIRCEVKRADKTIIAWGDKVRRINRVINRNRAQEVLTLIADITDPYYLRKTQKGYPAHPNPRRPLPDNITPRRWKA